MVILNMVGGAAAPKPAYVDFLLVGGGGAGGRSAGNTWMDKDGGGGGGGVIECMCFPIADKLSPNAIIVGAGGTTCDLSGNIGPQNGGDTSAFGLVACGGGYGGGWRQISGGNYGTNGNDGGSGGGGGGGDRYSSPKYNTCGGIGSQGGNGADGCSDNYGGGGGGAGGNATNCNGGVGIQSAITGCYYGGGGGGGGGTGGIGGCGGGGNGAATNGADGCPATYYGGGGGGAWIYYGNKTGGNGCQGIVIVRYKTDGTCGIKCATGGTVTTSGSYTIHTFTSDGTFTVVK